MASTVAQHFTLNNGLKIPSVGLGSSSRSSLNMTHPDDRYMAGQARRGPQSRVTRPVGRLQTPRLRPHLHERERGRAGHQGQWRPPF